MYKHILLPTDGSPLSSRAAQQAIGLAKALGARVTVLQVTGGYRQVYESEGFVMPGIKSLEKQFEIETNARAQQVLDSVKAAAGQAGVECKTLIATSDLPHEAIVKQASKQKCDLIMMASHGRRGLQAVLLGSETQKVLTHSKIPVLVCR